MKRFVWRLQQVLDIKAKEVQTKRTELFQLTEKLARTRRQLLTQQRILKDIISGIAAKEARKRLGQQEFFLKYSTTSNEQIKKLENRLSEMVLQQRSKIAELLRVRRFKEGLERLRAEAKKRFIAEQERLEQKELDEGATISFARTMDRDPALQ
jgi:flagellar biosynthesis chaperone FliJ